MKETKGDIEERKQALCERYSVIKTYVCYFGVPAEQRDDIVQDVYVAAYNNIRQLSDINNMNGWLFRITQRKAAEYLKKRNLRVRSETEYVSEEGYYEIERLLASRLIADEVDKNLADCEIMDMVALLKAPAPTIIKMRFIEGYTLKEIAGKLNMNYNSVRTIESRAFKELKKIIIGRRMIQRDK